MAIELAVALGAIAVKTIISELIRDSAWDSSTWALVATQVVDAVVTVPNRPDAGVQRVGQRLDALGRQIETVGRKVDAIPAREFDEHMAAGRRYMRDLRDEWRGAKARRGLIERTQHEFVRAFGIAETMKDPSRQALADTAIAGCWLLVPSMSDVIQTIGAARRILEEELLFGATLPTGSYADVVSLCRAYGESPSWTGDPIAALNGPPTPGARVAVTVAYGRWTGCAGVEMRVNPAGAGGDRAPTATTASGLVIPDALFEQPAAVPGSDDRLTIDLRNTRAEWISVSVTPGAVIVRLPQDNTLPQANRVKPGESVTLTLPRPTSATTFPSATNRLGARNTLGNSPNLLNNPARANATPIPGIPTIGFVLPQRSTPRPALPKTQPRFLNPNNPWRR